MTSLIKDVIPLIFQSSTIFELHSHMLVCKEWYEMMNATPSLFHGKYVKVKLEKSNCIQRFSRFECGAEYDLGEIFFCNWEDYVILPPGKRLGFMDC